MDADGGLTVVRSHPWRSRLEFPIGTAGFEDQVIWNPRVSLSLGRVAFFHGGSSEAGSEVLWRRIGLADPACQLSEGFSDVFIAPQAGAYCYTTWCNLLDRYEVTGLE